MAKQQKTAKKMSVKEAMQLLDPCEVGEEVPAKDAKERERKVAWEKLLAEGIKTGIYKPKKSMK